MLSIFFGKLFGAIRSLSFWGLSRVKCCPFFREMFWGNSIFVILGVQKGEMLPLFFGIFFWGNSIFVTLWAQKGEMLPLFFIEPFGGVFRVLQSNVPIGGNAAIFFQNKKTFGDAARLLQSHVPKGENAAIFFILGMQLDFCNRMFQTIVFQKGKMLSISSKKLGVQLDFCNRTFQKGEMLSIFLKRFGDGTRLLQSCVPKGKNAANKKNWGMRLDFCNCKFQKGEMLPIFFSKIVWGGTSTCAIEFFQQGKMLSISFKTVLGMQLDLCNRMFHKGGHDANFFKSCWDAARLLQSYVPKGGNAANFFKKKNLGEHSVTAPLLQSKVPKGEMLPTFPQKFWGCNSMFGMVCSKWWEMLSVLGMQLDFCNCMFQKGEMLAILFKTCVGMQLDFCNRKFQKGENLLSIFFKKFWPCNSTCGILCSTRGNAVNFPSKHGDVARLLQSHGPKGGNAVKIFKKCFADAAQHFQVYVRKGEMLPTFWKILGMQLNFCNCMFHKAGNAVKTRLGMQLDSLQWYVPNGVNAVNFCQHIFLDAAQLLQFQVPKRKCCHSL